MADDTLYYKYNLERLIKEKTGEEPNLDKIRNTVERWVGRMAEDATGSSWEEIGHRVPLEFLTPKKEGSGVPCGLWSTDELERIRDYGDRRPPQNDLRGRTKWIGRNLMTPASSSALSPIDIQTSRAVKLLLWPLEFADLFLDGEVTISNLGETMRVKLSWPAYMIEGPIFCQYVFDNLHFHWSDNSNTGTEHAIDGKRYALEAHFVFALPSCAGYQKAVRRTRFTHSVIALLFQESDEAPFYQVFSYCDQVRRMKKEIVVSGNVLTDFADILTDYRYYNYSGSLTTPPFTTPVNWTVMKTVLPIHRNQLAAIRALEGPDGRIKDIVGPLQPLEDRVVLSSVDSAEERLLANYA